ncbi:NAD-dependent epimerase/dehydratase family protein [Xanthomonas cissicola]|uniref:GDP-mannose 4,6 dehydratase n=1 Tax=Xanthomonas cissicola TaxID=86186 RepID=A0ABX3LYH2_9XANT|nr:NAD-dependent epimerase/dehydratase family protein [Xanthomonas cissicola]KAB0539666.1 NAD-dependent epimerase/dehydratase family protein [Xanthomonas cissicola]OOW61367.1 GDP-mannose 4,6 dehydratase [Xanthomonas cissicola]OOW89068.1 GDP-mannose 4,6 dehydratase [Xanthomonas campestris pv. vitistrifoliae]
MSVASLSNQKVALVTGATGFTGRYVKDSLERAGYAVHGWSHGGPALPNTYRVDMVDREQVRTAVASLQPEVVVHLAAISFVAHGDVDGIYRLNVVGTRNLLDALAANAKRPARVLLASSANIYGNAGGLISEDVMPSPQNDYAVSKLAMEYMAKLWAEVLPITIIRPFNYTGVGQSSKFLLPKIVQHFQKRAAVMELGNVDVSRDFYDVRCVAEAITRLVSSVKTEGVYNISSGNEYSLRDVVDIVADIADHQLEVVVNPAFVRGNEVKSLRGDNRRLIDKIGTLPEFDLRKTLAWMFENPVI